jgi:hypothetical protein
MFRPLAHRAATAAAACAFALAIAPAVDEPAEAKEPKGTFEYGCRVQPPQRFLERRTFHKKGSIDPTKHLRAMKYLAQHYGTTGDSITVAYGHEAASQHAKTVHFFGMPLSIHEKIAPVVSCVEKHLKKACTGRSGYAPHAIGGFRTTNTYRGSEVSNHMFGIAIDIDPEKNPCCGCVDPWPSSPLCQGEVESVYKRTSLTKCWVRGFERFGFDWLGHDELEDTMHFEFLGDPDRIKH